MTTSLSFVFALLIASATAQTSCTGSGPATDEWCTDNCNAVPAFCPSDFCDCSGSAPVTTTLTCVGTTSQYTSFCNENCNHSPAYCPSSICDCTGTTTVATNQTCTSRSPLTTDAWCALNCESENPFCPEDLCECLGQGESASPSASPSITPSASAAPYYATCVQYSDAWCTSTCHFDISVCPSDCCSLTAPPAIVGVTSIISETDASNIIDSTTLDPTYQASLVSAIQSSASAAAGVSTTVTVNSVLVSSNKQTVYQITLDYTITVPTQTAAADLIQAISGTDFQESVTNSLPTGTLLGSVARISEIGETDTDATELKQMNNFSCADGQVIALDAVCNKVKDCAGGEDEMFC